MKVSPKGRRLKAAVGERELVAILIAAGLEARRVPLSGAMSKTGFGGDVLVRDGAGDGEARWEVKRRGQGFKRIEGSLCDAEVVAFRGDRQEWFVCLRLAMIFPFRLRGRVWTPAPSLLDLTSVPRGP